MARNALPTRHHVTPDLLSRADGYQVPRRGRLSVVTRHDGSGQLSETLSWLYHYLGTNAAPGSRIIECTQAVLDLDSLSATDVFGTPDDMKLRSCATLFAHTSAEGSAFHSILAQYYESEPDPATLTFLANS